MSEQVVEIGADKPTSGLAEDLRHLDIVIIHDPIRTKNGGIDAVSKIATFLEAPIYTLRQLEHPEVLEDVEIKEIKPHESLVTRTLTKFGLGRLVDLPRILEYQNWKPPMEADVIVTTGTRSAHVIHHPEQHRIHFYHTPPRWLWDLSHGQYDDRSRIVRWGMLQFANWFRTYDMTATHRHDHVIANSDLVKERVQTYYGKDAAVIYPPIDTFEYEQNPDDGYFVTLNRLVPAKRIDLIVGAFNGLDTPLKILGTAPDGREEYASQCRRAANENIEFLGWVSNEKKRLLLSESSGLIFAGKKEDFGIPPVEAMASGKPVIGVNEGFTKYQVTEDLTGILFEPNRQSLRKAVQECSQHDWDTEAIQAESRKYDTRAVRQRWMGSIREIANMNDA